MTDFAAVQPVSSGAVITEQSGTAVGTDTVPAGCCLLVRNTGAGTHHLVIGVAATVDGMLAASGASPVVLGTRQVTMTAGQVMTVRIPGSYGDANGRVPFGVFESTFSEVKYSVISA
jgi:hypothetical protein